LVDSTASWRQGEMNHDGHRRCQWICYTRDVTTNGPVGT
jgi:hypothetical protein